MIRPGIKVMGVSRMADNEQAVLVMTTARLTDDELRSLHDHLREWSGPFDLAALQRLRKAS